MNTLLYYLNVNVTAGNDKNVKYCERSLPGVGTRKEQRWVKVQLQIYKRQTTFLGSGLFRLLLYYQMASNEYPFNYLTCFRILKTTQGGLLVFYEQAASCIGFVLRAQHHECFLLVSYILMKK